MLIIGSQLGDCRCLGGIAGHAAHTAVLFKKVADSPLAATSDRPPLIRRMKYIEPLGLGKIARDESVAGAYGVHYRHGDRVPPVRDTVDEGDRACEGLRSHRPCASCGRSASEVAPEVVVLFGISTVGTALMQDQAAVSYDLPLRLLFRRDGDHTAVSYRDPRTLVAVYDLTASGPVVEKLAGLLETLVEELTGPHREQDR